MHVEAENYLSPHGLVLCLTSYSPFGEEWSRGDESYLDCFGKGLVGVSRISLQVQHFFITLVDLLLTIVGTFFFTMVFLGVAPLFYIVFAFLGLHVLASTFFPELATLD